MNSIRLPIDEGVTIVHGYNMAVIALGSNIEKERNIPAAFALLDSGADLAVVATAPIVTTRALAQDGTIAEQDDFANSAALVHTRLDRPGLRELLRAVESKLGRVRTINKFAPRTIDLDIVIFWSAPVTPASIPSYLDPDVAQAFHVAQPIADILPSWVHPTAKRTMWEIATELRRNQPCLVDLT